MCDIPEPGSVKRTALSHTRWGRRVVKVVGLRARDVNELVQMVFSGPFPLVIEDVADEGERIVVRARTPQEASSIREMDPTSGHISRVRQRHGTSQAGLSGLPAGGLNSRWTLTSYVASCVAWSSASARAPGPALPPTWPCPTRLEQRAATATTEATRTEPGMFRATKSHSTRS
jgi:hypothetical protein